MRIRVVIVSLFCISVLSASAARAQGVFRPVPVARQTYYKPFSCLPGYSVTETGFANVYCPPGCEDCQDWTFSGWLADHCREKMDGCDEWAENSPLMQHLDGQARRLRWGLYARSEFMHFWTDEPSTRPLVTTSPTGTPEDEAGVLGQPGTSTLFRGDPLYEDSRRGGRITVGLQLKGPTCTTIETIYWGMRNDSDRYRADNSTADIVARPYVNVVAGAEDALLIAYPGLSQGSTTIDTDMKMNMLQIAMRRSAGRFGDIDADYIIGYRRAELDDSIRFTDRTRSLSGPTADTNFVVTDRFNADNIFHGADFGFVFTWRKNCRLSLDLTTKVSLGRTSTTVVIDGETFARPLGGQRRRDPGGLYALPTNIGRYRESGFSAIGEIGLTLKYCITEHARATLGYTFFAWTDVARAADQIDYGINPTQLPPGTLTGPARPAFSFQDGTFDVNGLRLGLEIDLY